MNISRRLKIKYLVYEVNRLYKKYGAKDYRFIAANRRLTKVICE